jgi:transketolase
MPTFAEHVAIGEPAHPGKGIAKAMTAAAKRDPRILAIFEDMQFPDVEWWATNALERTVQVGIAEQNGAVVAAALASEGFIPVINNFMFAGVQRALNQIRQAVLVDRFNVKFIARDGLWGEVGVSHNMIEGIPMTRCLPNLVIIDPADIVEAEKATEAMMRYVGPVLIRQEASPTPLRIFSDDYPFEIGRAYAIREGRDATIIATGYMVTEAIRAVEILERDGIDVGVLNMSTIKPLDEDAIVAAAARTGAIVTAENGTVMGGLGDAVAAVLGERRPTPLVRVGIHDEFSQSGLITAEHDELMEHFALSAADLATAVRDSIALRDRLAADRGWMAPTPPASTHQEVLS